jgi:ATP synthase subunit 6 (eukaryotes),also subunit A (prokaryotes)
VDGHLNALWVWTQTGIGAHIPPPVFSVLSGIAALALLLVAFLATRNMQHRPGRLQNLAEVTYEFFDNLAVSVVGEHGRKYVPLAGTIFLFILFSNLMGLIPPGIAPTASLNTTIALALIVIIYVQYEGIRARGLIGYTEAFRTLGRSARAVVSPLLYHRNRQRVGEARLALNPSVRQHVRQGAGHDGADYRAGDAHL